MSESILYYPTIDIQDGAWLRSAALYWDEVCSIVPDQDYPDLSPELLYLKKRGCYRAIYPKDVFLLGSPGEFSAAVRHAFAPFFPKGKYFRKIARTVSLRRKTYSPEIVALIHYGKIPKDVMKVFTENDMVRVNGNGWIKMDDFFAQRYMRLLAEFITKNDRKDMTLGTDKISRISEIYPEFPDKSKNSTAWIDHGLEVAGRINPVVDRTPGGVICTSGHREVGTEGIGITSSCYSLAFLLIMVPGIAPVGAGVE